MDITLTTFVQHTIGFIANNWLSLIGSIGGITGFISYLQVRKMKSLDLRLEYGRSKNIVNTSLEDLEKLSNNANQSRERCYAAIGKYRSGDMELWKTTFAEKKVQIEKISKRFADIIETDVKSMKQLEQSIVELHEIKITIESLIKYFTDSIRSDDLDRQRLHDERVALRKTA